MGKQSRAKRERREQAGYITRLTACEGTWLARPPDAAEQARIAAAHKELMRHRAEAQELGDDDKLLHLSFEVLREPHFAPLHFDDWLIESVLDQHGEPPIPEDEDDPAFTDYLRAAVVTIASPRVRRAMAEQLRRFLPQYVEAGRIKEALVLDYNAYMTVMSDQVTPLLAQMLVGGLSRWYEEHEDEE